VNKGRRPKGTEFIGERAFSRLAWRGRMPGEMAKHFFESADMDTPVIVRE
jgi:hypothetical protein